MSESITIINLLSDALFSKSIPRGFSSDWRAVAKESVAQSVTVLAYEAAKRAADADGRPIPPDVGRAWKNAVNAVTRRNIRVESEHAELHHLMSGAPSGDWRRPIGVPADRACRGQWGMGATCDSIPYVILKGCASAMYYPEPFLRQLGDVDFLVAPEDAERADRLLRENGFTYKESSNTDERIYVRGKSVWELHTAANGTPGGEVGDRIRSLMSDVIDKAIEYNSMRPNKGEGKTLSGDWRLATGDSTDDPSNATFLVPSEFHHGLILLLHTARHMTTGGVGLRQICDWAVFVSHIGDRFPALFEEKLRSVGLWKFACILTQLSSEYLGAPAQSWAGEPDRELLKALMDDVFAGGNFGGKDKSRRDQAKFITDRKSGGAASRSTAGQAVRSANEIVRRHWPIAGKLPVLYPAGWAFFGGRYAIRAAFGKREKLDVRSLSREAKERNNVYCSLKLFIQDQ